MLIIVVFLCPLYVPVTIASIDNMNWSVLIVGATILLPGIYWIWRARFRYIRESNTVLTDNVIVVDGITAQRTNSLEPPVGKTEK